MNTSIIIVSVEPESKNSNLKECLKNCERLQTKPSQVILLPDFDDPKTYISLIKEVLVTIMPAVPPLKRDKGARYAKGEILAFLDDDAYPSKEWLTEALKIFREDENIGCVCGPAVTPPGDSLRQKASGLIYSSVFVSGNHSFRYIPKPRREVSDFPSCNFLIRKDLFKAVGGFNTPYWPGEDTFLCLKVLNTGKKMIYSPKVLVYHHRREVFLPHLRQIKNYALHRGYFAKKYPKTSLRIEYFIPSFLVIGLIGGVIFGAIYFSVISLYLAAIAINSFILVSREKTTDLNRAKLSGFIVLGIILTHLAYGIYFVKGLTARKMPEEKS